MGLGIPSCSRENGTVFERLCCFVVLKKLLDSYRKLVYTNKSKRYRFLVRYKKTAGTVKSRRKGDDFMPLTMIQAGQPGTVKKVGGREDTRRFLENLGFVIGTMVTVISEMNGNMIVSVKDTRVAIGKDMANKILV